MAAAALPFAKSLTLGKTGPTWYHQCKEQHTMTIHLPPELESSIQAAVHRGHFASVDAAMTEAASLLLERLKQQDEATPANGSKSHKPIWEVAADIRKGVPAEEWAKLPTDGAEQHDHYIYGTHCP
jgi:Arc/MetJ-type ribon-helix-helix transcriptional regulator